MAAKAAASVVWLTAITLGADRGSALASVLAALAAVLGSVFFVTGAFNFSGADFAAALTVGFAFEGVTALFAADFGAAFGAVLATVFVGALLVVFALPAGLAAATFFAAVFIDLPAAVLVAVELVFFAAGVLFAGFFIAFAMESIPTEMLSLRKERAC